MDRDRYDQLVREFLKKKRIAIWGVEDAKCGPGWEPLKVDEFSVALHVLRTS